MSNLSSGGLEQKKFEFRGNATEYFGIWIINILLSLVTLGIYTAWAKVRRQRYFYGNTFLDGHNFEYLAKPKQILIGRIIVVVLLVVYNLLVNVSPAFGFLIIPYLIILPWFINKALKFNARVTSYRNVRFDFEGRYMSALLAFVVMPLLAMMTLGLLAPFASKMASNYIGNNLYYGKSKFQTDVLAGPIYKTLGLAFLMAIGVSVLFGGIATSLIGGVDFESGIPEFGIWQVLLILIYPALLLPYFFYQAGVRNSALNATSLQGGHKLVSQISRLNYAWIVISNLVASICSLGLLIPWAAVRAWRYLMDESGMVANGSLDDFVGQRIDEGGATSAEFLDIEGIDFGL